MTAELDDCRYFLIYEVGGEQHIETFYTKQEMEQFIAESNARPLFQYDEKIECEL